MYSKQQLEYSDKEIKNMEAAIKLLHEDRHSVEGRHVRGALRNGGTNELLLLNEMEETLKLVGSRGDFWFLTAEGRKAADIGLKRYLGKQRRKSKLQDLAVKVGIIGGAIGSIGGIMGMISFLSTCSGQ